VTWKPWTPYGDAPRVNMSLLYLGACVIAGLRLAREKQVNVRVVPISAAIDESVELAHEVFCRVYRKVPEVRLKNFKVLSQRPFGNNSVILRCAKS
jgi:hypothetical protein